MNRLTGIHYKPFERRQALYHALMTLPLLLLPQPAFAQVAPPELMTSRPEIATRVSSDAPATVHRTTSESHPQSFGRETLAEPYPFFVTLFRMNVVSTQHPALPFDLTSQQQAELDSALETWERRSRDISNFICDFAVSTDDIVFNSSSQAKHLIKGRFAYAHPDHGVCIVDEGEAESWAWTGKAIYVHEKHAKQVIEWRLPAQLRRKFSSDGPFPFLFRIQADKLKQRFFMRLTTSDDSDNHICVEARPRYWQDAAYIQQIKVTLSGESPIPMRLELHLAQQEQRFVILPGGDVRFNVSREEFIRNIGITPRIPPNWDWLVDELPEARSLKGR